VRSEFPSAIVAPKRSALVRHCWMSFFVELLAQASQVANDKARELGWIV
jgi:hypothetical protein